MRTLNSTEPGEGCGSAADAARRHLHRDDRLHRRAGLRADRRPAGDRIDERHLPWQCSETEATDPLARPSRLLATTARKAEGGRESASLAGCVAVSRPLRCRRRHRHSGGKASSSVPRSKSAKACRSGRDRGPWPRLGLRFRPRRRHCRAAPPAPLADTRGCGPPPRPGAVAKPDPGAAARGRSDRHRRAGLPGDPPAQYQF